MIEIIDIGASPFEEPAPYEHLVSTGQAHVVGFEPDQKALAALASNRFRSYLPHAVADGQRHTYYKYKAGGFNSLFQLDKSVQQLFPEASEWFEPQGTEQVATIRLDDLGLPCDFLKIDCQGGELMALQGGQQTLARCVLIQIELIFTTLYVCQPSLWEVDKELRRQGFEPRNLISSHIAGNGAVVDADFLYVRRGLTEAQGRTVAKLLESCYPRCVR